MQQTFPLLPLNVRFHICNFSAPEQLSLQAGARPASVVGARNVVPGSFVVATNSICPGEINPFHK